MSQDCVDKYTNVDEKKHNAIFYKTMFLCKCTYTCMHANTHYHQAVQQKTSKTLCLFLPVQLHAHFYKRMRKYKTIFNMYEYPFSKFLKDGEISYPSQTFPTPALPLAASFGADWLVLPGQPSCPGMTGCYYRTLVGAMMSLWLPHARVPLIR